MTELQEFNDALRELKRRIDNSLSIAMDARYKIGKVVEGSHLKSTMTMLKEDIVLRRMLDMHS